MDPYKRADHWTQKAKAQGYAARSVFKLDEIHQKFPLFGKGAARAVDLGCFPGSWSRWLLKQGLGVVGVDLHAPELEGGTWIVQSALEVTAEQLLEAAGGPVDLLVSDMAPNTTGNKFTDHVRQIALATQAYELSRAVLKPSGAFVAKVFDGQDAPGFVKLVQGGFSEFKRLKPDATRDRSVEFFVAARGRR